MTSFTTLLIVSAVMIVLLDIEICSDLRILVYSFLLSKRNIKGAKKIHKQQTRKDRFTLEYIKEHAIYQKEFRFFQKFRMIYLYSLLPIYAILVILYFVSKKVFLIGIGVFIIIKICIAFYVRTHSGSSPYITIYDKRYKEQNK